jgi:hypothetical protein
MTPKHALNLPPRLLTLQEAKAYCGPASPNFPVDCAIEPVKLSKNLRRWDRFALDRWINSLMEMTDDDIDVRGCWLAQFSEQERKTKKPRSHRCAGAS